MACRQYLEEERARKATEGSTPGAAAAAAAAGGAGPAGAAGGAQHVVPPIEPKMRAISMADFKEAMKQVGEEWGVWEGAGSWRGAGAGVASCWGSYRVGFSRERWHSRLHLRPPQSLPSQATSSLAPWAFNPAVFAPNVHAQTHTTTAPRHAMHTPTSHPPPPPGRPQQVTSSVSSEAVSMSELKRWNEQYGEGGSRRTEALHYFT